MAEWCTGCWGRPRDSEKSHGVRLRRPRAAYVSGLCLISSWVSVQGRGRGNGAAVAVTSAPLFCLLATQVRGRGVLLERELAVSRMAKPSRRFYQCDAT